MTDTIELSWQTDGEENSSGFYLFRRDDTNNGEFIPLTGLIVSQGADGGTYTFVDEDVTEGTFYSYLLVERKDDGTFVEHRNRIISIPFGVGPGAFRQLYLPVIMQAYPVVTATPTPTITPTPTVTATATVTVTATATITSTPAGSLTTTPTPTLTETTSPTTTPTVTPTATLTATPTDVGFASN
jgi:hypothetical protein